MEPFEDTCPCQSAPKGDDTFLESIAEQVCVVAYVFDFYVRSMLTFSALFTGSWSFTMRWLGWQHRAYLSFDQFSGMYIVSTMPYLIFDLQNNNIQFKFHGLQDKEIKVI